MKELALSILDIVQNSLRAEATTISVSIKEISEKDVMEIEIKDNGRGIPENMLENVTDPFVTSRTTRRVGLGLPLLRFHAELTGGGVYIESEEGKGTDVKAVFGLSHPDTQPLGDISGVMVMMIAANPEVNFIFSHKTPSGEFSISSAEIKTTFENETLKDSSLLRDIKEYIDENLESLGVH